MYKTGGFVIFLALSGLLFQVSASETGIAEDQEPENTWTEARADDSGDKGVRGTFLNRKNWPFFVSVQLEGGRDSNVAGLDDALSGVDTVSRVDLFLEGQVARRWRKPDSSDYRITELAGGASFWRSEQDDGSYDEESYGFYLRGDVDLSESKKANGDVKSRWTLGGQIANWRSRVGGVDFPESATYTAGVQYSWKAEQHCNLDNLLVFYEVEDFDDGSVSNPLLSRSGTHRSFGADVNLYRYGGANKSSCRRPGIFRRFWPAGITAFSFGYRNDDIDAASEYASEWHQLYFEGRVPVQWHPMGEAKSSVDFAVGASRADYDNPSIFAPFVAREDTPWYGEAAFVRHFKKVDFHAGLRWESNSSDVTLYDYDRTYVFFGMKFENFRDRKGGSGSTGSSGSSSDRRSGQSGSSGPITPGQTP